MYCSERAVMFVATSHRRRSNPYLHSSVLPSGLNSTLKTLNVCPMRVRLCAPVTVSHRRMVPNPHLPMSLLNDIRSTRMPGEHRLCVVRMVVLASVIPILNTLGKYQRVRLWSPVTASHRRMVILNSHFAIKTERD